LFFIFNVYFLIYFLIFFATCQILGVTGDIVSAMWQGTVKCECSCQMSLS